MTNPLNVKVVPAEWLPADTGLLIYNGVDNIVKLDGTDKEARYEVKKPKMVVFHTGPKFQALGRSLIKLRTPDPAKTSPNKAEGITE